MLKNSPARVLHILSSGQIGGAERSVEWFMQSVDQVNFNYEVVFLYGGGIVQTHTEKMGIPTHILNWANGNSLIGRWRLIQLISSIKPDIIQFHDTTPLVKIIVKCCFPRTPLIHTCHGFLWKSWITHFGRLIDDRFADFVICNSDYTLLTYGKTYQRSYGMIRIYLGLMLEKYRVAVWSHPAAHPVNGDGDILELIYLGSLHEYKGVLDLPVLAVELQKLDVRNFRINIVGSGTLYDRLKNMAKSLAVEEKIILWGSQENIIHYLTTADILVFPSWCDESFGLVLLEALACGLSVVAYNSGAASEIISAAPGAVIVEKKNIRQMAEAIADIAANKKYPVISECINYLEPNFNVSRVVSQTETLYADILDKVSK